MNDSGNPRDDEITDQRPGGRYPDIRQETASPSAREPGTSSRARERGAWHHNSVRLHVQAYLKKAMLFEDVRAMVRIDS